MKDAREKIIAAYDLLQQDLPISQKLSSAKTLIKGINPKLDEILEKTQDAHQNLSKVLKGDVVELSAESLPEGTEEEKKRKKAALLFIKHFRELESEIERAKREFGSEKNNVEKISDLLAKAKGPFGIITIAAVVIVGGLIFFNSQKGTEKIEESKITNSAPKTSSLKIKVIDFEGKKIPLSELITGVGPECLSNNQPAEHYHALDHQASKAIDGERVQDPGGCGFGKTAEVKIEEIYPVK